MKEQRGKETSFARAVHAVVRGIGRGQVMTYGMVALQAGFPQAGRAVGTLMKQNFDPSIPCHRVVCADGSVGAYNRGKARKIALLIAEGVPVVGGKIAQG